MSDDMTAGGNTGHCCQCAGACYHTSPAQFCDRHSRQASEPWNPVSPYQPWPQPPMPANGIFNVTLTDADVDRIARRVVELLRQAEASAIQEEGEGEYPSG